MTSPTLSAPTSAPPGQQAAAWALASANRALAQAEARAGRHQHRTWLRLGLILLGVLLALEGLASAMGGCLVIYREMHGDEPAPWLTGGYFAFASHWEAWLRWPCVTVLVAAWLGLRWPTDWLRRGQHALADWARLCLTLSQMPVSTATTPAGRVAALASLRLPAVKAHAAAWLWPAPDSVPAPPAMPAWLTPPAVLWQMRKRHGIAMTPDQWAGASEQLIAQLANDPRGLEPSLYLFLLGTGLVLLIGAVGAILILVIPILFLCGL